MLTWDNLKGFDMTVAYCRFPRANAVHEQYKNDLSELASRGISINDHILSIIGSNDILLTKNKYPYLVEPNVCHYVFWMRPGTRPITMQCAKMIIFARMSKTKSINWSDMIIFENVTKNKSVKLIPHYQVFIRDQN